MMLGKLQRAHPTLRGHFPPAYLVGSNMLRAYLFFIYDRNIKSQLIIPDSRESLFLWPDTRMEEPLYVTTSRRQVLKNQI